MQKTNGGWGTASGAQGATGNAGPAGPAGATGPAGSITGLIHGSVASDGSIVAGTGFTITKTGTGAYTINFTSAFGTVPIVILTSLGSTIALRAAELVAATPPTVNDAHVQTYDVANVSAIDAAFHFFALAS